MSFAYMKAVLDERRDQGLFRKRRLVSSTHDGIITIDGKACLNFASNDYLGLSQHPDVLQAFAEGLAEYGAGSTASAAVCGHMLPHQHLEDALCTLFNKPGALLFNSGFSANQALCQALFSVPSISSKTSENTHTTKQRFIVCDKLMHASFLEGAMHTNARLKRFRHNDLDHLSSRLATCFGDTLVATEGVFSMDGDLGHVAHIQSIIEQCREQSHVNTDKHIQLMVDDAHAFGVVGKTGLGSIELPGVNADDLDIVMATFGKALGTAGAFIVGDSALTEYLINFAKHYIYSTAMPPAQAVATLKSLHIMQLGKERQLLDENIALFTRLAKSHGLALMPSSTAIQPLLIGEASACMQASEKLMALGIFVPGIRPPTVEKGKARLRITLSALHTANDIHALVDALCLVRDQQGWET
jgi:8-amino-7-oxononanoate synthase